MGRVLPPTCSESSSYAPWPLLFPKTVPYFTTSPVMCAFAGIVERYAVGACEICHNGYVNNAV